MNKGDLINEVAKVVNTKKEAQAVADCIFDAIIIEGLHPDY
jgi:nucleoid DNA-binding protein